MAQSGSVLVKEAAYLLRGFFFIACTLSLVACAKPQWRKNLDNDIQKITARGWTDYETLGVPQEGAATMPVDWFEGPNVTFYWRTDGVLDQRKYDQEGYIFGASNYATKSGERFTFVFRKPRQ